MGYCWLFSNTKYLFKQAKGGLEVKLVEFQEQGCLLLPSLNNILLNCISSALSLSLSVFIGQTLLIILYISTYL
jgi:hypothetical protein